MGKRITIILQENLVNNVDEIAQEEKTSRSKLIGSVITDYLEARKNRKMLDKLNEVYSKEDKESEKQVKKATEHFAETVEQGEW